MSYRHSQRCLGAASNIHFVRRTFAAERQNIFRGHSAAVSYPKLNVMVFSQECEGTCKDPCTGHYSVITQENLSLLH